jgi:hypothetical protein
MFKTVAALTMPLALGACVSAEFTKGMAEPVQTLKQSARVTGGADGDVLKAYAAGMVSDAVIPSLPDLVCIPSAGPAVVSKNLGVFADSLDVVKQVGEKPSDTSYAGYIKKMRENAANAASAGAGNNDEAAAQLKLVKQWTRCMALLAADDSQDSLQRMPKASGALPAGIGKTLALDAVLKVLLGQIESAQREAAVQDTIKALIPVLESAREELKQAPSASFGPFVKYPDDQASAPAFEMNKTIVGAAVNIRRWLLAKQIASQWTALATCRTAMSCLKDPATHRVLDDFTTNVVQYRALARVDAAKIVSSLDTAIAAARSSFEAGKKIENWIDSLIAVSDAVTDLSDVYGKFEEAKKK